MAEVVGHPITGFALYAVLIPIAHLTTLYNYALTHDLAHDNEHLAFLVIGYLFWRPVVGVEPSRHPLSPGLRMVYLMLAIPVDTFSGLALVSATHEMFPGLLQRPPRLGTIACRRSPHRWRHHVGWWRHPHGAWPDSHRGPMGSLRGRTSPEA